jgi:hypothetical protein
VFPEAAAGLQDRMFGGTKLYPSEPISADLSAPETAQEADSEVG